MPMEGDNYDAGKVGRERTAMEGSNDDGGSDVEGIFPEEFRNYVRDQNLFCRYRYDIDDIWVFRNKHQSESDDLIADIVDKFSSLLDVFIFGPKQCMIQFWRAQELMSLDDFEERHFRLTTRNQPFLLAGRYDGKTPFMENICSYRMKMLDIITGYGGRGGIIGRVFGNKRMECTPNIGYYSDEEHPHRDLALSCHFKSSLLIPLSDSSGRSVGVVEIVSSVELNLFTRDRLLRIQRSNQECLNCSKDIWEQYDSEDDSLQMAVSEIKEMMQLVGGSCLFFAQTWMMCNSCSYLHTSKRLGYGLGASCDHEKHFSEIEYSCPLKKGEGLVGKAAASSHNLVYCNDVSQFSITEYPLAHFARHHKRTACFATCLQSYHTGNQIYVLEFFLNPSKVNESGPRATLVAILQEMRRNFRTFKFASGEEIGDNLSVQVIDAGFPDKFEILEIGRLDAIENYTFEMELIHNGKNVVNTIEEGVAIASLDKQGGKLTVDVADAVFSQQPVHIDSLGIDNGENMGSNIDEQRVEKASLENQHNNATISSDERVGESAIGVINSDISLQPLVEANVIHPEENVVGASEECIINSSKRRGGIDISLEELQEVSSMKREDAAKRLKVSVSTFKRVCRDYKISRWPPRKKKLDQTRSGNSAETGSTIEFGGSAPDVQNESLVTMKAKYGNYFIKFKLSASSGINEFNQQVSKRLKLEAGSYVVKYQDDDNDWILVACDDDLQDYISSSASLGKTTLTVLLEHI